MARGDDNPSTPRIETIEPAAFKPPGTLTGFAWPQLPWIKFAVFASLCGALGLLVFIFSARSVQLLITPAAELRVAGSFAPHFRQRWMLLPGPRMVEAAAPGFHPLREKITISHAPQQTFTLKLRPLPGHLQVVVKPAVKAEVVIDDQRVGAAPGLVENVAAGARQLVVRAPRYLDFTATIEVTGKGQTQEVVARLQPAWAEFSLASKPEGARVLSDKDALGVTPLNSELLQGVRQITVVKQGYKPWLRRIEVVAGQAVAIPDVRLIKDDGYFSVTSAPAGAAVTVDGKFKGETPVKFAVTPDVAHDIAAMKTGYVPGKVRIAAKSGAVQAVPLQLAPELAVIDLVTTPADAELVLNGTPHGRATQRLELPTHEHEIIVRKAGYATYRTLVTPRKGVAKRLQIRLKTAAEMAQQETARNAAAVPPGPQNSPVPALPLPAVSLATSQASSAAQRNADLVSRVFAPPALSGNLPAVKFAADGMVRSILGQELKLIRGGEFRAGNGGPTVRLARPFYLGLREVSNRDYRHFISNHLSQGVSGQNLDAEHLPVINITWAAAATYCNWLSRRESLPTFYQIKFGRVLGVHPDAAGYRLPTEAEWAFAASVAPDNSVLEFPWSGAFPPRGRAGNFADHAARELVRKVIAGYDDGFAATAPVGSFAPNMRGFYDLAGNVSEWIHDFYAAPSDHTATDPLGPTAGAMHVTRGSSWAHGEPTTLRLNYRAPGAGPRNDLGFRLARYAQ